MCPGWAGLRPAIHDHPSGWEGTKCTHSKGVSGIDVLYCWAGHLPAIHTHPFGLSGWMFSMVRLAFGQPYTIAPSGLLDDVQSNALTLRGELLKGNQAHSPLQREWHGCFLWKRWLLASHTLPPLGMKRSQTHSAIWVSWMNVSYDWGGECNGGMGRGKDGQAA